MLDQQRQFVWFQRAIAAKAVKEHIYLEERFSDPAPLVFDSDFDL